jgi:hypothetical protein
VWLRNGFRADWRDCRGVALEFRRLGLGPIRSENEYRFPFTVANAGTFGTITSERRLF